MRWIYQLMLSYQRHVHGYSKQPINKLCIQMSKHETNGDFGTYRVIILSFLQIQITKKNTLVKVKYVDLHGAQTERCPFFIVKMQSTRGGLGLNIQSISMLIRHCLKDWMGCHSNSCLTACILFDGQSTVVWLVSLHAQTLV